MWITILAGLEARRRRYLRKCQERSTEPWGPWDTGVAHWNPTLAQMKGCFPLETEVGVGKQGRSEGKDRDADATVIGRKP